MTVFYSICVMSGQQVCVRLEKNDRDLGFSLEGGVGSSLENRPLTVQKIFQGEKRSCILPFIICAFPQIQESDTKASAVPK